MHSVHNPGIGDEGSGDGSGDGSYEDCQEGEDCTVPIGAVVE